jgi:histidine phosphotransferase ChpT
MLLPKNQVKLLLNLILLAMHAIPRGGMLTVSVTGAAPAVTMRVVAAGLAARVPPRAVELLAGDPGEHGLDAHAIQPFYAGALAREAGMAVSVEKVEETVVFEARPAAAQAEA